MWNLNEWRLWELRNWLSAYPSAFPTNPFCPPLNWVSGSEFRLKQLLLINMTRTHEDISNVIVSHDILYKCHIIMRIWQINQCPVDVLNEWVCTREEAEISSTYTHGCGSQLSMATRTRMLSRSKGPISWISPQSEGGGQIHNTGKQLPQMLTLLLQ